MLRQFLHALEGAALGLAGGWIAEAAWPHGCKEYLPLAAALGIAGGLVGGWHARSLIGSLSGYPDRWDIPGAAIGGFAAGFSFYGLLFLYCWQVV